MISAKSFHTFGLSALVARVVNINSVDQLMDYVGLKLGKDFMLLGEGSNTVFLSDCHKTLLLMKLKGINISENSSHFTIDVNAGENWHEFVKYCLDNEIFGLENLALIPGSVGACPVQNIGAYGVEVNKFISAVTYFDLENGETKTLTNEECDFTYRNSIFKSQLREVGVITSVTFSIPKDWEPVVSYGELAELTEINPRNIFNKVIEIRGSKLPDPKVTGNSGSFFKNPIVANEQVNKLKLQYPNIPVYPLRDGESKLAAGWLIDQSGLKGLQYETVAIHERQALVLINKHGNATSKDLVHLISYIQKVVADKFGIKLEPEVRMFAESGEVNFYEFVVGTSDD